MSTFTSVFCLISSFDTRSATAAVTPAAAAARGEVRRGQAGLAEHAVERLLRARLLRRQRHAASRLREPIAPVELPAADKPLQHVVEQRRRTRRPNTRSRASSRGSPSDIGCVR